MNRSKCRSIIVIAIAVVFGLVGSATEVHALASCTSGPPICTAIPATFCSNAVFTPCTLDAQCPGGSCVLGITGTVLANGSNINTVVLSSGVNTALTLSGALPAASVNFRVRLTGGPAVVTDVVTATSGVSSSTVDVSFSSRSVGAPNNEVVCPLADNHSLTVISGPSSPGGITACSSHQVQCSDIAPAGLDYPADSRFLSVRSPIAGTGVVMELTKSGAFDARLRFLFARSTNGGASFTPFTNITSDVFSGSTKIRGTAEWSDIRAVVAQSPVNFPSLSPWGMALLAVLMLGAIMFFTWRYGALSRRASGNP